MSYRTGSSYKVFCKILLNLFGESTRLFKIKMLIISYVDSVIGIFALRTEA